MKNTEYKNVKRLETKNKSYYLHHSNNKIIKCISLKHTQFEHNDICYSFKNFI